MNHIRWELFMREHLIRASLCLSIVLCAAGCATGNQLTQEGSNMYAGWYAPAIVDVQVATIYTTLFDVRSAQQVWAFTAPTYDSRSLQKDAPRYARDVTGMLQSSGLLAGP
jgi:hypothetical protein